jgi:regulator of cell morphogenesis and NO signaling
MKTAIDATTPVGRIARLYPETVSLFDGMDVEYACKGGRALRDAAVAAGVSSEELLGAVLATIDGMPPAEERGIGELLDALIREHERFGDERFREILLRFDRIEHYPDAERLHRLLKALRTKMAGHMQREEREIFPRIEELDLHPERGRLGISRQLLIEFVEHDVVHEWLTKIRELTLRLRTREVDALLLDAVDEMCHALKRHLHLENNVLIPRVIDSEQRLKSRRMAEPVR